MVRNGNNLQSDLCEDFQLEDFLLLSNRQYRPVVLHELCEDGADSKLTTGLTTRLRFNLSCKFVQPNEGSGFIRPSQGNVGDIAQRSC